MPTNDFLPFATNPASNVMSQADYAALAARVNGFSSGTARSEQLNKAWRQSSVIAAVLAQFIVDNSGNDVLDDGDLNAILANLQLAIEAVAAGGVAGAGFLVDSNNLSDVVDAAAARTNLGLGTASTVDAQTSHTDDTLGRVLLTGAYGWGQGGIVIADGTDINTVVSAGVYRVNTGPNVPSGGEYSPMLVIVAQDVIAQMIINNTSGTIYSRGCITGGAGFGPWVTNWNSENFNPASYQPALGFTPVQQGTGVGQTSSTVKIGWEGGGLLKCTVDVTDLGAIWTDSYGAERVRAAIASFNYGEVGTFGLFRVGGGGAGVPGTLVAGANLIWSDAEATSNHGSPAGTWQLMGGVNNADAATGDSVTLCLRIA